MVDKHSLNNGDLVTADMLHKLPEPVQRYLHYAGVIGKPWINTVRLKYVGRFRRGADQPWMAMNVEQCYTTDPPGFVWKGRFSMAKLPLLVATDTYKGGQGYMVGKLAGLFKMLDLRGMELDQGAMLRYLNEMAWFPCAYLGENITWQAVDDHSAQVTLTDCGKSVSARMFFDDEGREVNFTTQRYREIQGGFSLDTWSTPLVEYGIRANLNLPVRGKAVWNLPSGDLPYVELEITEVDYNGSIDAF